MSNSSEDKIIDVEGGNDTTSTSSGGFEINRRNILHSGAAASVVATAGISPGMAMAASGLEGDTFGGPPPGAASNSCTEFTY